MDRPRMAGWALVGMTLVSAAIAADGGPAMCTGPDCVGANGYAGSGAPQGGFNQFWHRCHVDFLRNNSWPEPFLSADKIAVRTPFCIQVDNGWKMQNTIGSYLFDAETQRV